MSIYLKVLHGISNMIRCSIIIIFLLPHYLNERYGRENMIRVERKEDTGKKRE